MTARLATYIRTWVQKECTLAGFHGEWKFIVCERRVIFSATVNGVLILLEGKWLETLPYGSPARRGRAIQKLLTRIEQEFEPPTLTRQAGVCHMPIAAMAESRGQDTWQV